ncbi:DUF262 domain-containing protein [Gallionella capsiferriformans]|uniref:GmrSD restriction endonucleases N-terminal domain-containing protein n=1 Tax=Gallionella capsiferriformans (strain ES-2) TaxID=395494 RepID=D9SGB1_GALCS|nr:DUF262 domain-containing protein [Gallionella capsiferriformans]ADL55558.1 protein of unknown function DUF262 [Gallionella capsiferriformans ES-2]
MTTNIVNEIQTDEEVQKTLEGYEPPEPGGWEGYPLDELAIRDERRTASDVIRRIRNARFVLDPDFQREFVWDKDKQSRLIESILLRIPLPVFYVAEDNEGRLIVVDGRQRLTTLLRFLDNDLALHLIDRPELNGKRFDGLDVRLQNRVEDCQLLFYIIDRSVPERARLDIFERVNGGEVLTRQQMRNAIYNGPATQFLRDEALSLAFQKATGGSLNVGKMQDREMINRFCSFRLMDIDDYRGDMDDWLAKGLEAINKSSLEEMEQLSHRFRRAMNNNFIVFGRQAFRKHTFSEQRRSILNASLFDVMSTGLARYTEASVEANANLLREKFYALMEDEDFIRAITYGSNATRAVRTRFQIAKAMFNEVFNAA